jgi:hypothetical protein
VAGERTKRYCSYLIRCWWSAGDESTPASVERFVVERVTGQPQRWGFDSFDDLIGFLRVELFAQVGTPADGEPAGPKSDGGEDDEARGRHFTGDR